MKWRRTGRTPQWPAQVICATFPMSASDPHARCSVASYRMPTRSVIRVFPVSGAVMAANLLHAASNRSPAPGPRSGAHANALPVVTSNNSWLGRLSTTSASAFRAADPDPDEQPTL
jgi:hypothetical protein